MNNKRKNIILMRIIHHLDAIGLMNKSAVEIFKEEKIYLEQLLHVLILSLSINQFLANV